MQVHTEQRQVVRSNVVNEHTFTIKASAKAFSILSSNLYSDKPLAIVRELCCNAYDSHVAAGKADQPIEIILPTRINPQLVIKDFGTGLDHEQMIDIYTKFFESTKTESNDFVGQLGLGSKSPFSMFKTFSVEARKGGMKRVYAAFLNEDSIPTIARMGEEATDEPNGVTVSMHVKPDDIDKFYNAAQRALMYFNPRPIVSGVPSFKTYSISHGASGSNWKLRETDYWARMSGPFVVQGFVVYPIDGTLIKNSCNLSVEAAAVANLNIDFWMDIGSVDVAPSREALSYDKRTLANIAYAFERAATELRAAIQADFDSAKTRYEAGCKLYNYEHSSAYSLRSVFRNMHDHNPFTWNGEEVTYTYTVNDVVNTSIVIARKSARGSVKYGRTFEGSVTDIRVHSDIAVLIDDRSKGASSILHQFLVDPATTSEVILLRSNKRSTYDDKEVKRILSAFGDVPARKLTDLAYTPITSTSTKTKSRSKQQRLRFTGFPDNGRYGGGIRRVFSRLTWDQVDVDMTAGGFYMPLDRFTVKYNGKAVTDIDIILKTAVALGLLTSDEHDRVYGFNQKEIDAVANHPDWVNLFTYLAERFEHMNFADMFAEASAVNTLVVAERDLWSAINRFWNTSTTMAADSLCKKMVEKVQALQGVLDLIDVSAVNRFIHAYPGTLPAGHTQISPAVLMDEWQQVYHQYPLLKHIQWYCIEQASDFNDVVSYINVVDASK